MTAARPDVDGRADVDDDDDDVAAAAAVADDTDDADDDGAEMRDIAAGAGSPRGGAAVFAEAMTAASAAA